VAQAPAWCFEPMGDQQVKGRVSPVETFRLAGRVQEPEGSRTP